MFRAFVTILFLLVPVAASAQTPLGEALADIFANDDRGLRLLRDNGADLGPVLTVERLPSEQYVVEVRLDVHGSSARYPLKLSRSEAGWQLEWQPEGVYVAALLAMLKNDALPDLETSEQWSALARLPAMPIIATRKRFVTPFGEVTLDDRDPDSPPGDLALSPGLVRAAQWWVKKVLDDDPAPAGVDLLIDPKMSWKTTSKVLFNMSTVGLYQLTFVTRGGGALRVASPVRQAKFALVVYQLENQFGLRIATDGGIVPGDGCADDMTACLAAPSELAALLGKLETPMAPVMVAAGAGMRSIDLLRFAAEFGRIVGTGPHQLLVGYVQK